MTLPTKPEEMMEYIKSLGVGMRPIGDPFFEEGDAACGMYTKYGIIDIDEESLCHITLKTFKCDMPFCTFEFDNIVAYELHYNSTHRYSCSQCKKQLPSPHLLDLHLSETHDSFFKAASERKPMFCCFVENCTVKFKDSKSRRSHCIDQHKYPHDFKFDISFRKLAKNKKKPGKPKTGNVEDKNEAMTSKLPVVTTQKKPFSFGHRSYKFGKSSKPTGQAETNIEMKELMETLPSTDNLK